MDNSIVWPSVFVTGKISDDDLNMEDHKRKAFALSTALVGWGNCYLGIGELPENFGVGMAELQSFGGLESMLPDNLMKAADEILNINSED